MKFIKLGNVTPVCFVAGDGIGDFEWEIASFTNLLIELFDVSFIPILPFLSNK